MGFKLVEDVSTTEKTKDRSLKYEDDLYMGSKPNRGISGGKHLQEEHGLGHRHFDPDGKSIWISSARLGLCPFRAAGPASGVAFRDCMVAPKMHAPHVQKEAAHRSGLYGSRDGKVMRGMVEAHVNQVDRCEHQHDSHMVSNSRYPSTRPMKHGTRVRQGSPCVIDSPHGGHSRYSNANISYFNTSPVDDGMHSKSCHKASASKYHESNHPSCSVGILVLPKKDTFDIQTPVEARRHRSQCIERKAPSLVYVSPWVFQLISRFKFR